MFWLVKGLQADSKVEGGSDERLCFSEKERGKVLKDYMKMIMNKASDWDHSFEADAVVYVSREVL